MCANGVEVMYQPVQAACCLSKPLLSAPPLTVTMVSCRFPKQHTCCLAGRGPCYCTGDSDCTVWCNCSCVMVCAHTHTHTHTHTS